MNQHYLVLWLPEELRGFEQVIEQVEKAAVNAANDVLNADCDRENWRCQPIEAIRNGDQCLVLRNQDIFADFALDEYAHQVFKARGGEHQYNILSQWVADLAKKWRRHPHRRLPD